MFRRMMFLAVIATSVAGSPVAGGASVGGPTASPPFNDPSTAEVCTPTGAGTCSADAAADQTGAFSLDAVAAVPGLAAGSAHAEAAATFVEVLHVPRADGLQVKTSGWLESSPAAHGTGAVARQAVAVTVTHSRCANCSISGSWDDRFGTVELADCNGTPLPAGTITVTIKVTSAVTVDDSVSLADRSATNGVRGALAEVAATPAEPTRCWG